MCVITFFTPEVSCEKRSMSYATVRKKKKGMFTKDNFQMSDLLPGSGFMEYIKIQSEVHEQIADKQLASNNC